MLEKNKRFIIDGIFTARLDAIEYFLIERLGISGEEFEEKFLKEYRNKIADKQEKSSNRLDE